MESLARELAGTQELGALLELVRRRTGGYVLLEHWQQGEFHHDVVIRVERPESCVIVVATNCNGGVKEVSCFGELPKREAVWHERCPASSEFSGELPKLLARARTPHWFDPCELLLADARSELRSEFRVRQSGGGWMPKRGA